MNCFGNGSSQKAKAISQLRDMLATLKYEIWESEPRQQRKDLRGNEWNQYIEERLEEWPYFNLEYIEGMIYKPKNIAREK